MSASLLRARELLTRHTLAELPHSTELQSVHDAFFGALLEGAFLVAAADGVLTKEEIGSLADLIAQMTGETVTPGQLGEMVSEFSAAFEKEGRAARLDAMAAAISDPAKRREILGFAALVALADKELAASELFVLHSIARTFGLGASDVSELVARLRQELEVAS